MEWEYQRYGHWRCNYIFTDLGSVLLCGHIDEIIEHGYFVPQLIGDQRELLPHCATLSDAQNMVDRAAAKYMIESLLNLVSKEFIGGHYS